MTRNHLHLIWPGLVLLICRGLSSVVLPIYDDAFITLRYARNLASGIGFVYQRNEWILGTTSPGFGLLNSLFFLLRLPMPSSTVVANVVADLVILYLTLYVLRRAHCVLAASVFAILFSVSPILNRICVGGMEANWFLALSLMSVLLYIRSRKLPAFALAALAYLFRPEALILLGVLLVVEWFREKSVPFRYGILSVSMLAAFWVVLYFLYGRVVPQSVIAKSHLHKPSPFSVLESLLLVPDPIIVAAVPLSVLGFVRHYRESFFVKIIGVWCATYAGLYLLARPQVWSWYGEAIYYSLCVLSGLAIGRFADVFAAARAVNSRLVRVVTYAVTLAPICIWAVIGIVHGPSKVTQRIYKPVAEWCRQNTNESTSILAYDIGVIGYYSNSHICDLAGLVWPEASKFASTRALIQKCSPDYLFLTATRQDISLMLDPELADAYRPIARFSQEGASDLRPRPDGLPAHWTQNYILYQRVRPLQHLTRKPQFVTP